MTKPVSTASGAARRAMTPDQALGRAVALMNDGKLSQAENICRQIIEARPNLLEPHNILAVVLHRQGRLDDAIKSLRRAVHLNGSVASLHANLGEMLRQNGETDQAVTALRRATHLDPQSAQAFNNLGVAYYDKSKFDDAVKAYERAVKINPDYPEAHNNMGNALRALDRNDEAEGFYERALALRPDYAEAYSNFATLCAAGGKTEQAEKLLRKLLTLRPGDIDNYRSLGNNLLVQGREDEAIDVFKEALRRDESNVAVLVALARAHLKRGNPLTAEGVAKAAMALDPENPEVICAFGQTCQDLDRLDEAVAAFEDALARRPDYAECRNFLAVALKSLGDFDRARAELETVLEHQPGMIGAYATLADMKTFSVDDPHFRALQAEAEKAEGKMDERSMFLHYPLGKAYDDIGDSDAAFRHYCLGAKIKRSKLSYDEEDSKVYFEELKATFDASYFSGPTIQGHPTNLPIFIVGMPRSGSTLVEQILSAHENVFGAGEIKHWSRSVHALRATYPELPKFPALGGALQDQHYNLLAQHYLTTVGKLSEDAGHITDKLLTNYLFVGLIHRTFPNAKIIHTRRNRVDTCWSCFTKLFKDEMPFSYDLGELGRYYRRYEDLMAHWRGVLPPGIMLDVDYEDTVDDLEGKAREIVEFCGLEWDDRCLAFHQSGRPVRTASVTQVRKPIYRTSVERWRRYEANLAPLLAALDH